MVAYEKYTAAEIVQIEDRLRTVTENLRLVRQLAEGSPSGSVSVQLGSCDPLLKRLESLSFNAVAAARSSQYQQVRGFTAEEAKVELERQIAEERKAKRGEKSDK